MRIIESLLQFGVCLFLYFQILAMSSGQPGRRVGPARQGKAGKGRAYGRECRTVLDMKHPAGVYWVEDL